ncbi:MAG: hypothetical protein E6147_08335, partial [Peptostreptococcus sp.]|nr:hypothetical protein [Peptostreptococcus sp.]
LYSLTYPFIIFDKIASILKNFLVSVTYVLTTKIIHGSNNRYLIDNGDDLNYNFNVVIIIT